VLPFILPAMMLVFNYHQQIRADRISAPESFRIVEETIGPSERRNLSAIASLVTHVAAQDFTDNTKDWFVRTPLQQFLRSEGKPFSEWILDGRFRTAWRTFTYGWTVASVDPMEVYFQANELFESTQEAKPIMITRDEVYGMLSVLMRNIAVLVSAVVDKALGYCGN